MEPGKTGGGFRTTSWTLIVNARASPADLQELLTRYATPIYAYLRRHGHSCHDAEDLSQAFITDVMLVRDLIKKADPARGRFRKFILTALTRFVIDEHRKQCGRDGSRPTTRLVSDAELDAIEPRESDDPATAFHKQWAATTWHEALRRTQEICRADGMTQHWLVFEARNVRPAMGNCTAPGMDEVAKEVGIASPELASSMLGSVKRIVKRALREVVEETVHDPVEVEAELAELMGYLER